MMETRNFLDGINGVLRDSISIGEKLESIEGLIEVKHWSLPYKWSLKNSVEN